MGVGGWVYASVCGGKGEVAKVGEYLVPWGGRVTPSETRLAVGGQRRVGIG